MALVRMKSSAGFRRRVDKIAGARVDWNAAPVVERIEGAIEGTNRRAAKRVKRLARATVLSEAFETGALYRSIEAYPSRYDRPLVLKRANINWIVSAGNDQVDYPMHVETGRYFKESGNRVKAVPFMRRAAASTRRWVRKVMPLAIKNALK